MAGRRGREEKEKGRMLGGCEEQTRQGEAERLKKGRGAQSVCERDRERDRETETERGSW